MEAHFVLIIMEVVGIRGRYSSTSQYITSKEYNNIIHEQMYGQYLIDRKFSIATHLDTTTSTLFAVENSSSKSWSNEVWYLVSQRGEVDHFLTRKTEVLVERVREEAVMMPTPEARGTKAVVAATMARKRATVNFIVNVILCLCWVCSNWLALCHC